MFEIIFGNSQNDSLNTREHKGKSIIDLPSQYVLIDIESTGLCAEWDEIIEIAAIRVVDNYITETFHSLVKPEDDVSDFIQSLTGITNEMLKDAPNITAVLPNFMDFINEDILVGYNVAFDINFLYDYSIKLFNQPITNNHIDLLRYARKCLPELKNHKLKTLCEHYQINNDNQHRAEQDCILTQNCFIKLQQTILEKYGSVDEFRNAFKRKTPKLNAKEITTEETSFDESHPLFNKVCVFTGTLDKMQRADAMQIVVDLGGSCGNGITKKTNYLIIGNTEYSSNIKNGKTNKMIKAEELLLKGQDIQIIPESVFYDMIKA